MLKQDTVNKIASLLKLKPEDLTTAIKDEKEVDVTIDDKLTIYTDDELQTLKSNSYKDGKKAGVEMEVDDLKKELGLDFQGKTVKGLSEAIKKKTLEDAKIEPNQKVKELEEKVTTLQKTIGDQEKQLSDKETEVVSVKINGELYKYIPEFGENAPALAKDEVIQLMKANGYEAKLEANKTVFYKNGELVKDKLANAVEAKDVVSSFLKEKKLLTDEIVPGGRGGSDRKPASKAGSISEIKKTFQDQGKNIQGEEFSRAVEAAAKDNPEFKME